MAPSRISNGDSDASSGGDVVMNDVPGPVARLKRDNSDFLMRVSSIRGYKSSLLHKSSYGNFVDAYITHLNMLLTYGTSRIH